MRPEVNKRKCRNSKAWGFWANDSLVTEEDGTLTLSFNRARANELKREGEKVVRVWVKVRDKQ